MVFYETSRWKGWTQGQGQGHSYYILEEIQKRLFYLIELQDFSFQKPGLVQFRTFFLLRNLKVWINGGSKSVTVALALLILFISYSIEAPRDSLLTDMQRAQSWVTHQKGKWLEDIKQHSLGDHRDWNDKRLPSLSPEDFCTQITFYEESLMHFIVFSVDHLTFYKVR